MQARALEPGTKPDRSTIELAGETMPDGVFDNWLENHAGHQAVQRVGADLLLEAKFFAEAHHFDREIVVDKRNLFAKRRIIFRFAKQPAHDFRQAVDHVTSVVRIEP